MSIISGVENQTRNDMYPVDLPPPPKPIAYKKTVKPVHSSYTLYQDDDLGSLTQQKPVMSKKSFIVQPPREPAKRNGLDNNDLIGITLVVMGAILFLGRFIHKASEKLESDSLVGLIELAGEYVNVKNNDVPMKNLMHKAADMKPYERSDFFRGLAIKASKKTSLDYRVIIPSHKILLRLEHMIKNAPPKYHLPSLLAHQSDFSDLILDNIDAQQPEGDISAMIEEFKNYDGCLKKALHHVIDKEYTDAYEILKSAVFTKEVETNERQVRNDFHIRNAVHHLLLAMTAKEIAERDMESSEGLAALENGKESLGRAIRIFNEEYVMPYASLGFRGFPNLHGVYSGYMINMFNTFGKVA